MPLFKTELRRHGMTMVPRSLDTRIQLLSPLMRCYRVSVPVPMHRNPIKETGTNSGGDLGVSFEDPPIPWWSMAIGSIFLQLLFPGHRGVAGKSKAGRCAVATETRGGHAMLTWWHREPVRRQCWGGPGALRTALGSSCASYHWF